MMSLPRLRDSIAISALTHLPLSGQTKMRVRHEAKNPQNTLSSALLEVDVEGPAMAGSARLTGLKKEDMEEGPAVEPSAADVEGRVGRCDRDGRSKYLILPPMSDYYSFALPFELQHCLHNVLWPLRVRHCAS